MSDIPIGEVKVLLLSLVECLRFKGWMDDLNKVDIGDTLSIGKDREGGNTLDEGLEYRDGKDAGCKLKGEVNRFPLEPMQFFLVKSNGKIPDGLSTKEPSNNFTPL